MVYIQCRTNIDCAKRLQWPSELPERPMIGDLIRSTSSTNKKHIELEIVGLTWVYKCGWFLQVELHLPKHHQFVGQDFVTVCNSAVTGLG